jgi:hypothetical protein
VDCYVNLRKPESPDRKLHVIDKENIPNSVIFVKKKFFVMKLGRFNLTIIN